MACLQQALHFITEASLTHLRTHTQDKKYRQPKQTDKILQVKVKLLNLGYLVSVGLLNYRCLAGERTPLSLL